MPFVADDLGAWLVGLLADAGRKKLTTLVLGSDQERALRQAATAAIQGVSGDMNSSNTEKAGDLAIVISEVFREATPDSRLAGRGTLLEGLRAGIAVQLSVLDDSDLTEVGQSWADVTGVRGAELAESLAGHLVREIMLRGSRGGPLTPLAAQLNHDLTHVQGQRLEGMLARLAEARDVPVRPDNGAVGAGQPLGEVTDPFALEVHRPVQPDSGHLDLPTLPVYVPREHDQELRRIVAAAADGQSGIAVLVGGSSTGKTRACWEALRLLRDQDPGWELWHPIAPSRPEAALAGLPGIGARTVVWLNEAQLYLDASEGLGERVAAALRELLRDPARGPVLVLATIWPSFWDVLTTRPPAVLTTRPPGENDPHSQARELLAGADISVPAAFTGPQLQRLSEVGDVRLAQAVDGAQDGQVIQFLAGAPELLARYRNAPPAAAAVINTAMDARRLGMRPAIPRAFLEAAAPGYLTDAEWDQLTDDWLEQAIAYNAAPCKGARGPLTRIRPRPAHPTSASRSCRGPVYLLADYLDQHGRSTRRDQIPPVDFWAAAARSGDPGDLSALGDSADSRGLYRDAAQLHKHATAHGDTQAVTRLLRVLQRVHPTDRRPARWCASHLDLDDPHAMASLLRGMRWVGLMDQVSVLAGYAAAHAALDDPRAVAFLLYTLREAGAEKQASALLARDPAAHVALGDPDAVAGLLRTLREAGAGEQVSVLADRAADRAALDDPRAVASLEDELRAGGAVGYARALVGRATLDDPYVVTSLLGDLRKAGAAEQAAVLLARDPAAHAALDDLYAVAGLLGELREAGASEQVSVLSDRAAAHATLDRTSEAVCLLHTLREVGAEEQASALACRIAADAALDDPDAVAFLLGELREAGSGEQASVLLARGPAAHVALDDPRAVAFLLGELGEVGAGEQARTLAGRAAADVALDDLRAVASLLRCLQRVGGGEQVSVLAARAADHVALDDPRAVAFLLGELGEVGAGEQARTLAGRAAADVALDDLRAVASLLRCLQRVGGGEQVSVLAARAADHVALDDPRAVAFLLGELGEVGAGEQARTLAGRAAADVALDDLHAVASLLRCLQRVGGGEQVSVLAARAADHVALDDPRAMADLLRDLRKAGAAEQAAVLLARDPAAHAPLDDTYAVAWLLRNLLEVGAREQASVLAGRAAADVALDGPVDVNDLLRDLQRVGAGEQVSVLIGRVALDSPSAVAYLLHGLQRVDADEQAAELLARDPAEHAGLDNPGAVANLLYTLREVGAGEQVSVLAGRAAAQVSLDNLQSVASLLHALRMIDAREQAEVLIERLPGAGMFGLFCEQEGRLERFRFGREVDGRPAGPWNWKDLD